MTTTNYVFINSNACQLRGNSEYEVLLGSDNNRPPYSTIELISLTIETNTEYSMLCLRTDLQATNSFQNDNTNPCLCLLSFAGKNQTNTHYNYEVAGFEQPKLVIQNVNKFYVQFIDESDLPLDHGDILTFTFMLKITHVKPNETSTEYRSQIPLPILRI